MKSRTLRRTTLLPLLSIGVGAMVVLASVAAGCGSTIVIGDDGSGGKPPVTPPECPASPPNGDWCDNEGLTCAYAEDGCIITYQCYPNDGCYGSDVSVGTGGTTSISVGTTAGVGGFGGNGQGGAAVGGYGGYGADDGGYGGYDDGGYGGYDSTSGCGDIGGYWAPIDRKCTGPVDCESANHGDGCAVPGDSCGYGDECWYTSKVCGQDHTWSVTSSEGDDCCYDCCDDSCHCDTLVCPDVTPIAGEFCEPCTDFNPQCSYEVFTECGSETVVATCNSNTYTWDVPQLQCEPDGGA